MYKICTCIHIHQECEIKSLYANANGIIYEEIVKFLQQGPPKGTTTSPRGRGRPKKAEEKPEITGEDEDEQEEEEEEEENWSN